MPKLIEYPRASFQKAMELAHAVDYIGGSCTLATAAEKINMNSKGGGFHAVIGAARKHGLIETKKDSLMITDSYKVFKHSYNNEETIRLRCEFFLSPPLYSKLYEKFKGKELPIGMLDKILIREYGVDEYIASRVAGYFVDGARECEILINSTVVDVHQAQEHTPEDGNDNQDKGNGKNGNKGDEGKNDIGFDIAGSNDSSVFVIQIKGTGIDTKIAVSEEDDFLILDAVINKLRKKLNLQTTKKGTSVP